MDAVTRETCFLVARDAAKRCLALAEKCYEQGLARGPNRHAGRYWTGRGAYWLRETNRWCGLAEDAARGS